MKFLQFRNTHSKPQSKGTKILLLAMGFFLNFGFANVCYLLPLYYSHIGFKPSQSGILLSAFYVASLFFRLILGGILPRFGFRKFLVTGGVLSALGAVGTALAGDNYAAALASRIIFGTGNAFTQIALATFQSLAFEEKERGSAFALIMAGGLAPTMTILPLADLALAKGYFNTYILINVFMTAALIYVTIFALNTDDVTLPRPKDFEKDNAAAKFSVLRSIKEPFVGLDECFKTPRIAFALFMMFMFSLIDATSSFMSPMAATFGLMMSFFLSTNAVVGVFVRVTMGKALDKLPREKLSVPITVTMSLLLLLATVHPTRMSFTVLGFIFGILMGFGYPMHLALVSDSAPRRLQPQAVAFGWFLSAFDFTIVPLCLSFLGSLTNDVTAFRSIVIFVIICCICAQFVYMRGKTKGK